MKKVSHFSKITAYDGEWRADMYPIQGSAFAKWGIQQYKSTPLGWIEMGHEERYFSKKVALSSLRNNGYAPVV